MQGREGGEAPTQLGPFLIKIIAVYSDNHTKLINTKCKSYWSLNHTVLYAQSLQRFKELMYETQA
jgi:hypothetical protein